MRIVLDTNVLVRATRYAQGPPPAIVEFFAGDDHELLLSPFILQELLRVLGYKRVQALHRLSIEECSEFVESLETLAEIVELSLDVEKVTADPDDDPVIQTAIEGSADVLCTLDRHLRTTEVVEYAKSRGVRILTDVELLNELRALDAEQD